MIVLYFEAFRFQPNLFVHLCMAAFMSEVMIFDKCEGHLPIFPSFACRVCGFFWHDFSFWLLPVFCCYVGIIIRCIGSVLFLW